MDCSLPGSSVHGDSPGKNTEVGCHALLQGIFLNQGSNPHLLRLLHWQAGSFTTSVTWEAQLTLLLSWKSSPFYKIWAICKATLQPTCGHDNFSTADPRAHFWSQVLFYPRPSDLQLPVYYEESSPVHTEGVLTSVVENQIRYLSLKFSLLYVIINISITHNQVN